MRETSVATWCAVKRSAAAGLAMACSMSCAGIAMTDIRTPLPVPDGSCVVVGFLGGRDRWDDETKGVRQLAQKLSESASNVHAETFENRRRDVALEFVERARRERREIRLVVYGQSFGGASVVKLARALRTRDIAVDLTVQVDSVGRGDGRIPPNVRYAANFYQDDGWFLEGEHPVEAEDPSRTVVLGNLRFDYDSPPGKDISLADVPWYKLVFRIAHARMDRDPRVWSEVERLVRTACAGELHPDVPLPAK
jgi:hypothetical protein